MSKKQDSIAMFKDCGALAGTASDLAARGPFRFVGRSLFDANGVEIGSLGPPRAA